MSEMTTTEIYEMLGTPAESFKPFAFYNADTTVVYGIIWQDTKNKVLEKVRKNDPNLTKTDNDKINKMPMVN